MKPGTRRLRDLLATHWRAYAVGTLLLFATNGLNVAFPWLLKIAFDGLEAGEGVRFIGWVALAMAGLAIVRAVTRTWSRLTFLGGSRRVVAELRETVFAHLQRLPVSAFDRLPSGELVSRLINDLQHVRNLFGWVALNVANTLLLYVVALALLLRLDVTLTFVALTPYVLAALFMKRYGRKLHQESTAAQAALARISARLSEVLNGILVVKAHRQEGSEIARFDSLSQEYWEASRRFARTRALVVPVMGSVASFGAVAVLTLGGSRVIDGGFTLGDFVAFNATLAMMSWPSIALGWILNAWQRGKAAMDRIEELLAEPIEPGGSLDVPVSELAEPFRGEIVVRDLTFTHEGSDREPAIAGVSFSVPAGTRLGLVGRTGSGKSTLSEILAGLRPPPRGSVFLDGVDLLDVPLARLRSRLSLVPQGAFVFSATLRENIGYGLPVGVTSGESVDAAIADSALAKDLPQLPHGLETLVGERGVTLSGGQRQRVTIARALAREHDLLILDDALSAVDADTEAEILEGLEERRQQERVTEILIAHRLSAVAACEQILVLERGRIVERGTHQELLARDGGYAAIWREQELERRVEGIA